MTYRDQIGQMQASLYAALGVPAWFTLPGAPAAPVTVLFDKPAADANTGGLWEERPKATPARLVRIRVSDLEPQGLMGVDNATRAPVPTWRGATINFDGVERPILDKPTPSDDLWRVEWVFALG
jgi:hypothetical protein